MKIYLSNHAKQMVKKRNISFAVIRNAFRSVSEISDNIYVVLVTKSLLKKFNSDYSNADSLVIVARLNKIITCFFPTNTEDSLKYSRYKGRKIIIVN